MERNERVLSLVAEWFDPHPQILKRYLLKYYVASHETEMKDLTTNRKFLKRTRIPASSSVSVRDLYIGGHVILFSRNLKIVDYGDEETKQLLGAAAEQTLVVISSDLSKRGAVGDVVEVVERAAELTVVGMKAVQLHRDAMDEARQCLGLFDDDSKMFSEDEWAAVVVVFQGKGSIIKARKALEDDGRYCSGVYCTSSAEETSKAQGLFLNQPLSSTTSATSATANNDNGGSGTSSCTCCVIKPHAIKSRQVGPILNTIASRGYGIKSLELFHLDSTAAAEFLEVYEGGGGAVPNFHLMVKEMCSGPVIAMEVCKVGAMVEEEEEDKDVVSTFRKDVAGPWDVPTAKELFPDTLRARFGVDNVKNAVHCTDLPRDGGTECQFFFDILAGGAA